MKTNIGTITNWNPFVPLPAPTSLSARKIALLLVLHISLAIIVRQSAILSTIHAFVIFSLGIYYAMVGNLVVTAYYGSYIMGAEVLWRMTDSLLFHEFGKYAISLIFLVALLRKGNFKKSRLAVLYFMLMLPSVVIVLSSFSLSAIREMLSFNLAGPLALVISVWFFSNIVLNRKQLLAVLFSAVMPIVSVATLTLYTFFTTPGVTFSLTSSYIRSGGYAPNQVAAILGLGALLALFILFMGEAIPKGPMIILIVVIFWLSAQSSLTFSRGGLINFIASAAITTLFIVRLGSTRNRIIAVFLVIIIGGLILTLQLNKFTVGALSMRFSNLDPTGRDLILRSDLQLWSEYFWFGVGPGVSTLVRSLPFAAAPHTEFTRLLAEHGIFGLLANGLFFAMAVQAWMNAKGRENKALVLGLLFWAIFFMAESATRLVAPSFLFGMVFIFSRLQYQSSEKLISQRHLVSPLKFQRGELRDSE